MIIPANIKDSRIVYTIAHSENFTENEEKEEGEN